jgi:hypothetical protein
MDEAKKPKKAHWCCAVLQKGVHVRVHVRVHVYTLVHTRLM